VQRHTTLAVGRVRSTTPPVGPPRPPRSGRAAVASAASMWTLRRAFRGRAPVEVRSRPHQRRPQRRPQRPTPTLWDPTRVQRHTTLAVKRVRFRERTLMRSTNAACPSGRLLWERHSTRQFSRSGARGGIYLHDGHSSIPCPASPRSHPTVRMAGLVPHNEGGATRARA